jgi:hypothetical protein
MVATVIGLAGPKSRFNQRTALLTLTELDLSWIDDLRAEAYLMKGTSDA